MRYLAENQAIPLFVPGGETLLNSTVESITIKRESEGLTVEILFALPHPTEVPRLLLQFTHVSTYSFTWNDRFAFYHVESYKLFALDTGYYLSLDPYEEDQIADEKDQDVVVARGVKAYAVV